MNESTSDTYRTLQTASHAEIKVKGSRFLATACPVQTRAEAEAELARISRRFHDATHNCFAYQVGVHKAIYRSSDAGEPAGTAGQPILKVIQGAGLTNILVVVTRYFGGTKLGIGGLIKAYTQATQAALAAAKIVEIPILKRLRVQTAYEHVPRVMRVVGSTGAQVVDSQYGETVRLTLDVPVLRAETLKNALINGTSGQAKIEDVEQP